jgi:hypothetical protein
MARTNNVRDRSFRMAWIVATLCLWAMPARADEPGRWRVLGGGKAQLQNFADLTSAVDIGLGYQRGALDLSLIAQRGAGPAELDEDAPTRDFGAFVLDPAASPVGFAAHLAYLPWRHRDHLWGVRTFAAAGKAHWARAVKGEVLGDEAIGLALGLCESLRLSSRDGRYVLDASWCGTLRRVLGDVVQHAALFHAALGTDDKSFWGLEPRLDVRIAEIEVGIRLPILLGADTVKGLTGGQLIVSVGVRGGVE